MPQLPENLGKLMLVSFRVMICEEFRLDLVDGVSLGVNGKDQSALCQGPGLLAGAPGFRGDLCGVVLFELVWGVQVLLTDLVNGVDVV